VDFVGECWWEKTINITVAPNDGAWMDEAVLANEGESTAELRKTLVRTRCRFASYLCLVPYVGFDILKRELVNNRVDYTGLTPDVVTGEND